MAHLVYLSSKTQRCKKKKNQRCSVYLKLGRSNPCSQFCFWTSWREYDSLCYPAISSQLLALQRRKEILPQCSYCFWMGIHIFRLLVVFMLNFIQEHKCIAPKDFLFGSNVFIYVSLTILIVGLNRKSAESLCYAGLTCFLSLMDWAGHLVSVGLVFCTFYLQTVLETPTLGVWLIQHYSFPEEKGDLWFCFAVVLKPIFDSWGEYL